MNTPTLEDEKRMALKLAYQFMRSYCMDRFMSEMSDYSIQWKDYCLTINTIVSALNREVRQQRLAEERATRRKEKNKEANVENIKKRGKRNEKLQTPLP